MEKHKKIIGKLKFNTHNLKERELINKILTFNGCMWKHEQKDNLNNKYIFVNDIGEITGSNSSQYFRSSFYYNAKFITDIGSILLLIDVHTSSEKDNVYLLQDLNAVIVKQGKQYTTIHLPKTQSSWHYNGFEYSGSILSVSFATELDSLLKN